MSATSTVKFKCNRNHKWKNAGVYCLPYLYADAKQQDKCTKCGLYRYRLLLSKDKWKYRSDVTTPLKLRIRTVTGKDGKTRTIVTEVKMTKKEIREKNETI